MRKELEEEREIFKFWTNSGKKVHNIINKKDFKKKNRIGYDKIEGKKPEADVMVYD